MVTAEAKYQEGVGQVAGFWIWNCPTCRSTIAHKGDLPARVIAHCVEDGLPEFGAFVDLVGLGVCSHCREYVRLPEGEFDPADLFCETCAVC